MAGGRVHKAAAGHYPQQQRHHFHRQQADHAEGGDTLGALPGRAAGTHHRGVGRSHSAGPGLDGGRYGGGAAGTAAYHRSFSSPVCGSASLGSLAAATKLFGPILGALNAAAGGQPASASHASFGSAGPLGGVGPGANGALARSPAKPHGAQPNGFGANGFCHRPRCGALDGLGLLWGGGSGVRQCTARAAAAALLHSTAFLATQPSLPLGAGPHASTLRPARPAAACCRSKKSCLPPPLG